MVDSDNTTTLPYVTRRKMLSGTAIAMAWGSGAFAFDMDTGEVSSDPVLTLWRQWQDAHRLTEHLCRRQQRLERQLIATVGFPFSYIRLSDGEPLSAYSREAIRDVLRLAPEEAAACALAEAELEAHKLRWDTADRDIGYSATVQAERDSADRASDLLDAMAAKPATSLAGVADLAPKFYPVLSSLRRFWVAVFGAVATDCGAEPFRLRSAASRRGLMV